MALRAREVLSRVQSVLTGRYAWGPFVLVLAYYAFEDAYRNGLDIGRWDLLLLSGFGILVLGLIIGPQVPARLVQMLQRLRDRGALEGSDVAFDDIAHDLELRARVWASRISLGVLRSHAAGVAPLRG